MTNRERYAVWIAALLVALIALPALAEPRPIDQTTDDLRAVVGDLDLRRSEHYAADDAELHRRALAAHRAAELARGLWADYEHELRRQRAADPQPDNGQADQPRPGTGEDGVTGRLAPGRDFTGPTPQPAAIGTGYGADAQAIARWNVVPYQTFAGAFEVGVVAFHIAGIDRVAFSVDGGPWTDVHEPTLNPRTGTREYWATLDAAQFSDGPVEVRAIAYPRRGLPRVLDGDYDFHVDTEDSTQFTGEHALTLHANAGGSLTEQVVELAAGEYVWGLHPLAGDQADPDRWLIVRPAPGVAKEDVVIVDGLQRGHDHFTWQRVKLEGITIRRRDKGVIKHMGLDESLVWFDGVDYIGQGRLTDLGAEQIGGTWWTDCLVSDLQLGQAKQFVRGCRFERIGEDVLRSVHTVINVEVDTVDRGDTSWHPAVIGGPTRHDNKVFVNVRARNLVRVAGWVVDVNQFGRGWHDAAIINCDFEQSERGNVLMLLGYDVEHLYVRDSRFVGSVVFREATASNPDQEFRPLNVVFESSTFDDEPIPVEVGEIEGVEVRE